ncbi:MAG TPA: type II toxin-antitoxin system RelE/ParE family toxin [Longimicrobium sp.]|nr:type II toxin-antitoxin system RelE/ParE family toxin [Longimicrobium sp.]
MSDSRKKLEWVGAARAELQAFPPLARRRAGMNLDLVQAGLEPDDWKPMGSVGPGVREIRVRSFDGGATQHRVVYVARFPEAVYVLHAFEKKTEQTPLHNLRLAAARYRQLVAKRDLADQPWRGR